MRSGWGYKFTAVATGSSAASSVSQLELEQAVSSVTALASYGVEFPADANLTLSFPPRDAAVDGLASPTLMSPLKVTDDMIVRTVQPAVVVAGA